MSTTKVSIINQCVKCSATFTSPERPLKLLPCLHTMCLDCLYGRIPVIKKLELNEQISSSQPSRPESESKDKESEKNGEQESLLHDDSNNIDDNSKQEDVISSTENVESNAKSVPDKTNDEGDDDKRVSSESKSKHDLDQNPKANASPEADVENSTKYEKENIEEKMEETSERDNNSQVMAFDNESDKSLETKSVDVEAGNVDNKPKPAKECPICRDPILITPGSLMDNMFASLDVTQTATSIVNTSHVCTACEEGQQANSYCVQCEEWLCDSCVDAHKRVRVTKDHVISPKDQVSSATSKSPWEQQMMCKQHRQEQLKFFCEKCETMTCRDCQLMDHKEHKYQFMDQAADQYKARLKGSLALMGEKRLKLITSRDEIEQKLMNCKEQKDTLQSDILRQADILVKGIRQAVWGVLSNLASFTDAATKRLNKEIDDVSDLIGKFDHCVQFMEGILDDGTSMSLLYSKGNVEAKCRKVYHTQVDPQSLKGNLMIQYKHDVNWLLGNLNKIGSIFVNGVRYPPEKISSQNRHSSNNSSSYQQDPRTGVSATSPHLQHMANQSVPGQRGGGGGNVGDWTKFVQTVSKPVLINQSSSQSVGPPNMNLNNMGGGSGGSLPPQLTLPSRRPSNTGSMGGHAWTGMPGSNFSGHFPQSQIMPQQQQQQQHMSQPSRPAFTPMRLHHRPAAHPSAFTTQNDRGVQGSGNMRSPPNYRMGGEASGSSISAASSRNSHGTPDPARPASAGMYDGNSRPDSGGGGPAMVDIKKERRDQSPDCVITSTSLRSEKQNLFQTSPMGSRVSETVLEMQKNLDDVIRAVPMDLSDNLEQISMSKPTEEAPPPLPPTSTTDQKSKPSSFPNLNSTSNTTEDLKSPTDEELRENWQGGNSMPGFSIPSNLQADPNDDYCACCHNGGDVLCCDTCPRVFHLQCHIPEIPCVPSGSFVCIICEGDKPVEHEEFNATTGKRLTPLLDHDINVCKRILLDLFCHPSSIPFHDPVNAEQVPNYYKIITQPRDFTQIKSRLQTNAPNPFQSIKGFLYDLRQVFINCAIYNKESSEVGKAGRMVRERFVDLVGNLMPQYVEFVKENPTPCFSALQANPDSVVEDVVSQEAEISSQGESVKRSASMENGTEGGISSPAKRIKMDDATE